MEKYTLLCFWDLYILQILRNQGVAENKMVNEIPEVPIELRGVGSCVKASE